MIPDVLCVVALLCKHGLMDQGPACGGDSPGSGVSMRPLPDYFGDSLCLVASCENHLLTPACNTTEAS